MRDIVRLKTERELVRIKINDGNAFWNEIGVNAGVSKLMLLSINLLLPVLVYAARHSLTAVRHKLMLPDITSYCCKLNVVSLRLILTPITAQPSTSKPQKKQSRRKHKKNTKVPHPSDSTTDVPNEEHVPTYSNDPLLSGEDKMKLTELMDMCTKLSERVLDLEHTKTAQAQEITNLKLRVKKLEKKAGFRTHNFKRLYKSAKPKEKDVVQKSSENVSIATTMVSTATTIVVATPAITTPPQQRDKGIAFRELVESTITTTVPS
ncbi:hypothetical protein Tco_0775025 [Tanacetum coccineum]